ncbi:MAG: 2-C-methyl-D-erythritol 2,4-cyclodiphosphate synthase [Bacteroidales bacterium]|nr:2-C-methyl-D-erythritol 2,4-cyclodiphosphate synthase [Bacteroidales bacterium]
MFIRVGFGYDVHQLAEGRKMVIGGVEIPHTTGPVAHSDGDVLIHAICDALLGAANLRDIGYHFPDNAGEFKNISSLILLRRTIDLLKKNGYVIGNIDSTLCLQRPKIKDYVPEMITRLAQAMETDPANVSIKATTTEKLGFVGEEKGVTAYAVALIHKE